ncbi:Transcriptional regulator-like protein [Shewanella sediminis HAW-EB3]|uniref:Transcriptional regulator-like protein n=1 Tax=Shewanella sediminis (strain HAW-EB3) TaxID=425104 RepID=A8FZC1_SHESH|nr:LysR family transcriptional regulator [Shewanella sediminis]ABV38194.1 Transcriptional regulator-like protein [Shewanella sediminis HAW-EB3]
MSIDKLLNLNLLSIEIFCQVYLKQSVIDVADHLALSQPKVSRELNALRKAFSDPLFIRQNNRLEATELAHNLYPQLLEMLKVSTQAQKYLNNIHHQREPSFTIATVPQLEINLPQTILKAAEKNNAKIDVTLCPWTKTSIEEFQNGDLDAAISFEPADRKGILSKPIIQHRGGHLIAREGHPIWHNPVIDEMINYPIVKLITMPFPANKSPLVNYAKRQGKKLEVFATVSDLGSAANTLLNSNAIIIVGVRAAVNFLQNINGLHAEILDYQQDKDILKNFSYPTTYLWLKHNQEGQVTSPQWLQQALEKFITEAHR